MDSQRTPLPRLSLRKRDFLVLALSLSLMNVVLFTLFYTQSMRRLVTSTQASLEGKLQLIDRTLRATLELHALPGRYLATNRDFQQTLTTISMRTPWGTLMKPLVDEVGALSGLMQSYPGAVIESGLDLYLYSTSNQIMKGMASNVYDLSAIDSRLFYTQIERGQEYTLIRKPYSERGELDDGFLYLARQVYRLYEPDVPFGGILLTRIPIGIIRSILAADLPTPGSTISAVDDQGWVQASSRVALEGLNYLALFPKVSLGPGDMVFFRSPFGGRDCWISAIGSVRHWYLAAVIPIREAAAPLQSLATILFAMLGGSLVVSALISYWLSYQIADPIEKLVRSIRKVQQGDFTLGIEYAKSDEFSLLVSEYNRMLERIDTLMKELVSVEKDKADAELTALQSQINPHFLYNALDTVNWMALAARQEGISQLVTKLSDFYRYSLSRGRKTISLGEELEQVRSYLLIQKTQHPDAFDYSLACSPEHAGYEIVKLVLQPLAENAIVHGFQQIEGPGLLVISVRDEGETLRIEVSDNGGGVDADRLNAALKGSEQSQDFFAIRNIDARIRERYGSSFGLSYRANADRGITAVLAIPKVRAEVT